MKVSTIAVCYGRKFNLGEYNSLHLEATVWADLEEGDDPDRVMADLQGQTREAVKREYLRLKPGVQPGQAVESSSQLTP